MMDLVMLAKRRELQLLPGLSRVKHDVTSFHLAFTQILARAKAARCSTTVGFMTCQKVMLFHCCSKVSSLLSC